MEVGEEGLHFIRDNEPGLIYLLLLDLSIELFPCSVEDLEDLDEEEMLMRAIALSLEEELCSSKGELLKQTLLKKNKLKIQ